ncbi:TPA: type III-A CRISPR-associated protein Csm2 [Candidatus Bipolaricaulota bacterium]|nr:type III-A CRISPR-associated protein Csm2 [Candidatus Bipolaricaulota bacterium]
MVKRGRDFQVPTADIKRAIEGDAEKLVTTAQEIGHYLARQRLSTSQIRNIFGEVKRMEASGYDRSRLILLKPRLAYAAGRHGGAVKDLRDVLVTAIDAVDDAKKFGYFVNFFEAILAYHREAGGK